ncbi:MAG: hypothetical protein GY928_34030 [Colwellia sp.]|nr:hypothetical protein [Colwellia sp.]
MSDFIMSGGPVDARATTKVQYGNDFFELRRFLGFREWEEGGGGVEEDFTYTLPDLPEGVERTRENLLSGIKITPKENAYNKQIKRIYAWLVGWQYKSKDDDGKESLIDVELTEENIALMNPHNAKSLDKKIATLGLAMKPFREDSVFATKD